MTPRNTEFSIRGHGLWYVDRDNLELYNLLAEAAWKNSLQRPERDVVIALLRWVLEELEKDPVK